jgi:hypothetical protein
MLELCAFEAWTSVRLYQDRTTNALRRKDHSVQCGRPAVQWPRRQGLRVTPSSGCGATQPAGQLIGTSGRCVDDSGSGTTNGNPIILYPCTGNANQHWTVPDDGTIRTLGRCLAVSGASTANGTTEIPVRSGPSDGQRGGDGRQTSTPTTGTAGVPPTSIATTRPATTTDHPRCTQ